MLETIDENTREIIQICLEQINKQNSRLLSQSSDFSFLYVADYKDEDEWRWEWTREWQNIQSYYEETKLLREYDGRSKGFDFSQIEIETELGTTASDLHTGIEENDKEHLEKV